jgi:hypothetical protein
LVRREKRINRKIREGGRWAFSLLAYCMQHAFSFKWDEDCNDESTIFRCGRDPLRPLVRISLLKCFGSL